MPTPSDSYSTDKLKDEPNVPLNIKMVRSLDSQHPGQGESRTSQRTEDYDLESDLQDVPFASTFFVQPIKHWQLLVVFFVSRLSWQ